MINGQKLGIGDPVVVVRADKRYDGKRGVINSIRHDGPLLYGVELEDMPEPHQARRWFSPGELEGEKGKSEHYRLQA